MANNELKYIGVSGDGDTASIGFGQFAHAVRRQVDMLYIVENNGTYGLTKGQFPPPMTGSRLAVKDKKMHLSVLILQLWQSNLALALLAEDFLEIKISSFL